MPWLQWARHELSPAGPRDRLLVEKQRNREKRNKVAVMRQIDAAAKAEAAETRRRERVAALAEQANERDEYLNYTPAARKAQRGLADLGVDLAAVMHAATGARS